MYARKIQPAILGHYRRAKALGRTVAEKWGEEEIHQFRVEVKKLRAYLRLSAAAHTGVKARLPAKLHAFYAMLGIIRCLQLQQKGLKEAAARLQMELPAACSAALEGRIGAAVAVVTKYWQLPAPLGKKRVEWHAPVHAHQAMRGAATFMREKASVLALTGALPDDEGLHAIRKAMKDILYVWPCFSKDAILSLLPERWRSREALDACTGWLGKFHDLCIQLVLLQDDLFRQSTDGQPGTFLEEVRQLWSKDKEELLEQLRHLLLPADGAVFENPLAPIHLNAESYELHVD